MKQHWTRFVIVIGAAVLLGSVLTLELYFNSRAMHDDVDVLDIAIPQFGRAVLWAVLAPLILRMRQRLPLSRGAWVGGVGFHLVASFTLMAVFYLGRMWSYTVLFDLPGDEGFWSVALAGFYGRNLIDMAYYWGVLAFGYSFELHQKYKNEELKAAQLETRLVETELKALRQQMHPHFLFNTLNTIAVLVRERRHDEAVTLITRLSSLLRMSLDNTGVAEVTLQQEVEFLGQYLEIQKVRFSDRLNVRFEIAPEARQARIPNLLLQPLVENAILHGIAAKTEAGHVEIRARTSGDQLHLEVRDDGPGLANGNVRAKEGVGLSNTRERLTKLYGPHAQLSLQTQPGLGVSVQITLPFRV